MPDIDMQQIDFASLEPEDLALLVEQVPDGRLEEFLIGDRRGQVLGEVFGRMGKQYKSEQAASVDAVIHWKISGGPGDAVDSYETVLRGGACTVNDELLNPPALTLTMSALTLLKLISGNAKGTRLVLTRKLKVDGDLRLAVNLPNLFQGPQ